jgi:hypothetical protein
MRRVLGVIVAVTAVACGVEDRSASRRSALPRDSVSFGPAAAAVVALDTASSGAAPSAGVRADDGDVVSSQPQATTSGGPARKTGGPLKPPVPKRSSGCGGTFVNVTVKESALGSGVGDKTAALRSVSTQVLAPVRSLVGGPQISPAIHAFRVLVKDPATAPRVVARLKASSQVEDVELDDCAVRIDPKRKPV